MSSTSFDFMDHDSIHAQRGRASVGFVWLKMDSPPGWAQLWNLLERKLCHPREQDVSKPPIPARNSNSKPGKWKIRTHIGTVLLPRGLFVLWGSEILHGVAWGKARGTFQSRRIKNQPKHKDVLPQNLPPVLKGPEHQQQFPQATTVDWLCHSKRIPRASDQVSQCSPGN